MVGQLCRTRVRLVVLGLTPQRVVCLAHVLPVLKEDTAKGWMQKVGHAYSQIQGKHASLGSGMILQPNVAPGITVLVEAALQSRVLFPRESIVTMEQQP